MPIRLIRPVGSSPTEIRCDVADSIVGNLAVHIVFFFGRRLDPEALQGAFARALTSLPVFAGRLRFTTDGMRIRCAGQGVPFRVASSSRTLHQAIAAMARDGGDRLVDPVNGPAARWGLGPLCTVRVTHLAGGATAIGLSWHHSVGDMQTAMHLMDAWAAAAAGKPVATPVIPTDRAGYLDEHLPAGGTKEPGVRCLTYRELTRGAVYLAGGARRQRTLSVEFHDEELARMRSAYPAAGSANDAVCAHVAEAIMLADTTVDRRTLAIAVNLRHRAGLDPMLAGNIITTLNVDVRQGDSAALIAGRIREGIQGLADGCSDFRANQRYFEVLGWWRGTRCVSNSYDPARWNPVVTNWRGLGAYRVCFEGTSPTYCTPLMKLPVAGLAAVMEGAGGQGLVFRIALPPRDFEAISHPRVQQHLSRFR